MPIYGRRRTSHEVGAAAALSAADQVPPPRLQREKIRVPKRLEARISRVAIFTRAYRDPDRPGEAVERATIPLGSRTFPRDRKRLRQVHIVRACTRSLSLPRRSASITRVLCTHRPISIFVRNRSDT